MAVIFTRILLGVSPTTIAATDILQFAGLTFNSPVFVDAYQDSTHVKTSVGVDKSSGNTPNNVKFISQAGGTGGDSQADWGDGTEDLDQITEAEATVKITVANASNITTEDAVFFSYDPAATIADPLAGIDVRAAEVGDANFVECEGSAAALALADQSTPATSHDFYIVISKSPTSNGLKSDKLRFETVVI